MMTNHGRTATSSRRTPGLAAAAVLLISMSGAASASVVDQVSPATDGAFNPSVGWQQEVVVGIGGKLLAVDLIYRLDPLNPPPDFIFSLYRGVG